MNTRRTLAAAGAVLAASALALAGCSASSPSPTDGSTAAAGSKGALAVSFPTHDVAVWQKSMELIQPMIEAAGYKYLNDDPNWDAQTQINDWTAWINEGDLKGIFGFPAQPDAMGPVTDAAKAAGIPVVAYAAPFGSSSFTVQLDLEGAGKATATDALNWIHANYPGQKVEVALLADTTAPLGQLQLKGFHDVLDADSNVVSYDVEASSRENGYSGMQSALQAHPDIKVALGIGADMSLGSRQAFLDAGVSATDAKHYYVSATDGNDEVYGYFQSGGDIWSESEVFSPLSLAKAESDLLIGAAEGKATKDETVGVTHVDASNVAQYMQDNGYSK